MSQDCCGRLFVFFVILEFIQKINELFKSSKSHILTEHNSQEVFRVDVVEESLAINIFNAFVVLLQKNPLEDFVFVSQVTLETQKTSISANLTKCVKNKLQYRRTCLQGLVTLSIYFMTF